MDEKNNIEIELTPPHRVELPPPPRKAKIPAPPSLPKEPQLDSVALESAEPSSLSEQPSYPQHQLIIERRNSGIMLRTLFFATVGFGLGILIGVGFLLS